MYSYSGTVIPVSECLSCVQLVFHSYHVDKTFLYHFVETERWLLTHERRRQSGAQRTSRSSVEARACTVARGGAWTTSDARVLAAMNRSPQDISTHEGTT